MTIAEPDRRRKVSFPGKDSASEMLWTLFTTALPTSFSHDKNCFPSLAIWDLNVVHHSLLLLLFSC